jgi:putative membrane protein
MFGRRSKSAAPISLTKGLLAGIAGGLVGSVAKSYAETLFPPRLDHQTPHTSGRSGPPAVVADQLASATGTSFSELERHATATGLHWGFGTLIGGVYGTIAELQPKATSWSGIPFGLTVNRVAHDQLLPAMGAIDPKAEQPAQERISQWMTHLVYGISTELVRRQVRKRL